MVSVKREGIIPVLGSGRPAFVSIISTGKCPASTGDEAENRQRNADTEFRIK